MRLHHLFELRRVHNNQTTTATATAKVTICQRLGVLVVAFKLGPGTARMHTQSGNLRIPPDRLRIATGSASVQRATKKTQVNS